MGFVTGCRGVGVGVGVSAWTGRALGRAANASGSAHNSAQPAAGCLLRDEAMGLPNLEFLIFARRFYFRPIWQRARLTLLTVDCAEGPPGYADAGGAVRGQRSGSSTGIGPDACLSSGCNSWVRSSFLLWDARDARRAKHALSSS